MCCEREAGESLMVRPQLQTIFALEGFFFFFAPSLGFVTIFVAKLPTQNFSAANGVANVKVQIITKAAQSILTFVIKKED